MEYSKVDTLISKQELDARMKTLAKEIAGAMGKDVMVVSLLKGSFMFTADLIREMYDAGMTAQVDFITLSSYGKGTTSSGTITVNRELVEDLSGKEVLIVDDILESGRTLQFAKSMIEKQGAKSVKLCVLLEKPGKLAVDMKADFVGFSIPDKFVVGYGLDYANNYRELPFVGVMAA